ncbi:MAG: AAA family ATPase [Myxococcota bacterium]
MGIKNCLVEGVSCTGKTSVCDELLRRGHHAVHGDRELAYQGDPKTGEPLDGLGHQHHIWDVPKVEALASDDTHAVSFFRGGSRNFDRFLQLFDYVFVLNVDPDTLNQRLDRRGQDEWGGKESERRLVVRLHATQEDVPREAIIIDATAPIACVVDEILLHIRDSKQARSTEA